MLIGTYSSIYISAPVLVWLGVKPDSFLRADEKDEPRSPTRLIPFSNGQAFPVHPPLGLPGAHANEVPMLKLTRSLALLLGSAAILPARRAARTAARKGDTAYVARDVNTLYAAAKRTMDAGRLRAGGQAVRRGRAPAPLFGLGPARAADERVQLLSGAANIPRRSARRGAS